MAFKVNVIGSASEGETMPSKERPTASADIYLDKDGNAVPAGKAAHSLLVRAGAEIPPGYKDLGKPSNKARKGSSDK